MGDRTISPVSATVPAGDVPNDFLARWRTSGPPLRPPPEVPAAIAGLLPPHDSAHPILLLGVTPELAVLPKATLAIDRSLRMIRGAWPGSAPSRNVIQGDWQRMPLPDGAVAGVIGDGSFSGLIHPEGFGPLFEELRRVVRPGGRVIFRCFATPEQPETVEQTGEAALSGTIPFHVFKLRFNMAAARELGGANVTSDESVQRFRALFPDRQRLSEASGWSLAQIAEMDAYAGCPDNHAYPSRIELAAALSGRVDALRFVETAGYALADHCPLLVADFR